MGEIKPPFFPPGTFGGTPWQEPTKPPEPVAEVGTLYDAYETMNRPEAVPEPVAEPVKVAEKPWHQHPLIHGSDTVEDSHANRLVAFSVDWLPTPHLNIAVFNDDYSRCYARTNLPLREAWDIAEAMTKGYYLRTTDWKGSHCSYSHASIGGAFDIRESTARRSVIVRASTSEFAQAGKSLLERLQYVKDSGHWQ